MNSVSCSMYSFVRFEYSNSMAGSPLSGIACSALEALERVHEISRDGAGVDLLDRPLKPDGPVGPHLDAQGPARHAHLDNAVIAEPVLHGRAGHGARRGARGQRVAGAALPDEDVHRGAGRHVRPLDIDAIREGGMSLDERAQASHEALVE